MRGVRRFAVVVAVAGAALAAGAYGSSVGSGTGAAASRPARIAAQRPNAAFLAESRAALVSYLRHRRAPALHTSRTGVVNARSTTSYNWSGYVDLGAAGAFTSVAGSWTVPAVQCGAEDQITSEWVGLDGWSSKTVEQTGTTSWCYKGVATYYTWYEMYPADTVEVGATVQPGDQITTSVTRSGTTYTLALTDATRPANSFSQQATCAAATCKANSAEWVAERPAFSIGVVPLAQYGTWTLTNGTETANGVAGTIGSYTAKNSPVKLTMDDATDAYVLNSVSALTGAKAFTTTWHNSY